MGFGGDAFKFQPLIHEHVRGKGGAALFRKTAGTSGFNEPSSSPQFVSHLATKIVKNVGLDFARTLLGAVDSLQHDRLHLRLVGGPSGSATPS